MKRILSAGFAALFCLGAAAAQPPPTAAPALKPYVAVYSISWSGTALGEGTITLAPQTEKDCYRFQSETKPMALVRMFYGSPRETSLLCLDNGVVRVRHFEYYNDKRDKDNFSLDFDWQTHRQKILKGGDLSQRDLPEQAFDRFGIQLAVRLWVVANGGDAKTEPADFIMTDDDRVAIYRFAIKGRETVETPAGSFEAVRVERIDNPNKTMRSWLDPARDYLPVKIERIEDGKVKLRMLLK